jgi:hypothetical protein
MLESELLLEIGSQAYDDLTSTEITHLTSAYTSSQISLAGLKAFDLLRKKFQPTYRMGKTYENLSQKYEFYNKIYKEYAMTVNAGKISSTSDERDDHQNIDRWKFTSDEN